MERLKSVFISLYLLLTSALAIGVLWQCLAHWPTLRWSWFGAALACAALPLWLLGLYWRRPPRVAAHLPGVTLVVWLGSGLAVFGTLVDDNPDWRPLASAAAGLAGFLLYLLWYSHRPPPEATIQRGMRLPAGTLRAAGRDDPLDVRAMATPTLWCFFRGNWSPLCCGQVRELLGLAPQLAGRGMQLVLVSPQPLPRTEALCRGAALQSVRLCQDPGLAFARRLGLVREGGMPWLLRCLGWGRDVLHPTLMVTDAEGDLILLAQCDNERSRPDIGPALKALERGALRDTEGE